MPQTDHCPRGNAQQVRIDSRTPFCLRVSATRRMVTATVAGDVDVTHGGNSIVVTINKLEPGRTFCDALVFVPDDIEVQVPAGRAHMDISTREQIGKNVSDH